MKRTKGAMNSAQPIEVKSERAVVKIYSIRNRERTLYTVTHYPAAGQRSAANTPCSAVGGGTLDLGRSRGAGSEARGGVGDVLGEPEEAEEANREIRDVELPPLVAVAG